MKLLYISVLLFVLLLNNVESQSSAIEMYLTTGDQNVTDCGYSLELACNDINVLLSNFQKNNVSASYSQPNNVDSYPELVINIQQGTYNIYNVSLLRYNVTLQGDGVIMGSDQETIFVIQDQSELNYKTNVQIINLFFNNLTSINTNQPPLLLVNAPNSDVQVTINNCQVTQGFNSTAPFISILPNATAPTNGITNLFITNCKFSNNTNINTILMANFAFVKVHHSTFTDNTGINGTALNGISTEFSILDATFNNNKASGYGGIIYSMNGIVIIESSSVSNSIAGVQGGAVYFHSSSSIFLMKTSFKDNFINTATFTNQTVGSDIYMTSGVNNISGLSTFRNTNFTSSSVVPSIYSYNLDLLLIECNSKAPISFFIENAILITNRSSIISDQFGCLNSTVDIIGTKFEIEQSICETSDIVQSCFVDTQVKNSFSCDAANSSSSSGTHGLSTKDKIIIGVIFGLAGLFVFILLAVWCYRRQKHHYHHYQRF